MNTLWKATFESLNFTFEAFGESKEHALAVLYYGWAIHAKATGAVSSYMAEYSDDICVSQVEAGQAYRDGLVLTPPRRVKWKRA